MCVCECMCACVHACVCVCVSEMRMSSRPVYSYINTILGVCLCVQIVGHQFDTINAATPSRYYETIYGLLDSVSPEYRNSFSETLIAKLQRLQPEVQDEESMDTK